MRPRKKRPPLATPGPPFLCKEPGTQNTVRMGPWLSTYWPHQQPQLRHACPDPPSPPLLICPRPTARKPFLQESPQPPGCWPPSAVPAALCGAPAQPSDLRELGEKFKPERVFPSPFKFRDSKHLRPQPSLRNQKTFRCGHGQLRQDQNLTAQHQALSKPAQSNVSHGANSQFSFIVCHRGYKTSKL